MPLHFVIYITKRKKKLFKLKEIKLKLKKNYT